VIGLFQIGVNPRTSAAKPYALWPSSYCIAPTTLPSVSSKKDERADSGNMKLGHHNLSAIPGSAEYLVTTTKKVVGLALQKLPRWFHIPDTTKEIHLE